MKSLKSGKESKITTTVLYPKLWPHIFLSLMNARRDIKYDELTLKEFVAVYGQILQSPDIVEIERFARLKHSVSLMYLTQQYEWQAVLSFHGAVLLEIERGLLKWGDLLFHLESRTLYGHPKAPQSSTTGGSSTSSTTVLYCHDFQRQQCSFNQAHYGYLRGGRKWLRHICSDCWVQSQNKSNIARKYSDGKQTTCKMENPSHKNFMHCQYLGYADKALTREEEKSEQKL